MMRAEQLLRNLLSSGLKADIVVLFRKNPGIIDTKESIARRLGAAPSEVDNEIADLVNLGFLRAKRLGKFQVVYLDEQKDKTLWSSTPTESARPFLRLRSATAL